jgi:mRNA interferase MazF
VKRGDLVTVALPGNLGKPRPAVIVESDKLSPTETVLICPCTSFVRDDVEPRRVLVVPTPENGLRVLSQIQADKVYATKRDKCGPVFGRLEPTAVEQLNGLLLVLLGLAD